MVKKAEIDILLRAFGVSGVQAVSEVEEVEETFDVEVLPRKRSEKKRKLAGYDQFEAEVRHQSSEMSQYYEIFYCLEVSIRQLVENTLSESEGAMWWNSERVPEGFRTEVSNLKKKDEDSGITPRSENALDYLTFGQLGQLITSNFDLFGASLSSKSAVSRIMNQLNMLRNPIAHCCPLAEDEKERLELTVRDWFRLRS